MGSLGFCEYLCDGCPVHWRGACGQFWYDSMSIIKSEPVVQRACEQIVVSLPEENPPVTSAYNQAWRSYWRRNDIWEFLKDVGRSTNP